MQSAERRRDQLSEWLTDTATVAQAASAIDAGLSTLTRRVKPLCDERLGKMAEASFVTPQQSDT